MLSAGETLDASADVELADVADTGPAPTDAGPDCSSETDDLPLHLACASLYDDIAAKSVRPDHRSFAPALSFWSDGADKERFVYLPAGTVIDATDVDEWIYPIGTELWKEFKVGGARLETRVFKKTAAGWKRTTYRWNADETDATRLDTGERVELPGRTPLSIPTAQQCDECHLGRKEPVLGFRALEMGFANARGATLSSLIAEGRLSPPPPSSPIAIPDDGTGLAPPALLWLHMNCGHCHNDNPTAAAFGSTLKMSIRATQLIGDAGVLSARDLATFTTGVCKDSERDSPSGGKYLYIAGGDPTQSLAAILLGSRATPGMEGIVNQMPPLATHVVDEAGQKLVNDWISALTPCP